MEIDERMAGVTEKALAAELFQKYGWNMSNGASGGEAHRAEAAARHHGSPKSGSLSDFWTIISGVYLR